MLMAKGTAAGGASSSRLQIEHIITGLLSNVRKKSYSSKTGLSGIHSGVHAPFPLGTPGAFEMATIQKSWFKISVVRRHNSRVIGPAALTPVTVATGLRQQQMVKGVSVRGS
jgi:hypothetical protein